jgi:hypothetical protein
MTEFSNQEAVIAWLQKIRRLQKIRKTSDEIEKLVICLARDEDHPVIFFVVTNSIPFFPFFNATNNHLLCDKVREE